MLPAPAAAASCLQHTAPSLPPRPSPSDGPPPSPQPHAPGIVTAYVFTWVPEWTTWVLLLAMALYDVLAGEHALLCLLWRSSLHQQQPAWDRPSATRLSFVRR